MPRGWMLKLLHLFKVEKPRVYRTGCLYLCPLVPPAALLYFLLNLASRSASQATIPPKTIFSSLSIATSPLQGFFRQTWRLIDGNSRILLLVFPSVRLSNIRFSFSPHPQKMPFAFSTSPQHFPHLCRGHHGAFPHLAHLIPALIQPR